MSLSGTAKIVCLAIFKIGKKRHVSDVINALFKTVFVRIHTIYYANIHSLSFQFSPMTSIPSSLLLITLAVLILREFSIERKKKQRSKQRRDWWKIDGKGRKDRVLKEKKEGKIRGGRE